MDERKEELAISFWTSLIGLAPPGLAALVFLVWGRADFVAWLIFAATLMFFGIQFSSITAGLSEHKSKSGKAALVISITAIVLAVATAYFGPMREILSSPFVPPLLLAVPITGILAGATAIDVKNRQTRILKPMLIIWFMAFVLTAWPLTHLVLGNEDLSLGELPVTLFALLFGPWALRITGHENLHGANNVLEMTLWLGLGLTVALAVVSITAVKAKRPRRAAVLLTVFAGLLLSWLGIGVLCLSIWPA